MTPKAGNFLRNNGVFGSLLPLTFLVLVLVLLLASCSDDRPVASQTYSTEVTGDAEETGSTESTEPISYRAVVRSDHPHDPDAYTQGLEFLGDKLLESTGLVGQSSLRLVEPTTGEVTEQVAIDEVHAEGITVVGDKIWQLTWTAETVIVHGVDDLEERERKSYRGEGWGLCHDGRRLIMSNGSSSLTFRNPDTFEVLGSVTVLDRGQAVDEINELECVGDRVWANVYQTNRIIEIDPVTGTVTGSADLSELVPDRFVDDNNNVLNGIAFNDETNRFWVTGKRWPVMYEVELVPAPEVDG